MNRAEIELARNIFRPRAIIEAEYDIKKSENDLIDYVMAMIASPLDEDENLVYEINVKNMLPLYNNTMDSGSLYKLYRGKIETLMNQRFKITSPDGNEHYIFQWVQFASFNDITKVITLKLGEDFKKLLTEIKYVKGPGAYYDLSVTFPLSSQYAKRLYYMFKEWTGSGSTNIRYDNINDLRRKLCIPSSYKYSNFKQRIVIDAVNEINEKTDIRISYVEKKTKCNGGEKVTGITWMIEKKKELATPLTESL